jgi:predicted Zn finger-like uncharacterized protein
MDIACPTCAATYEIDGGSVSETGRKVRCAACGTIWRAYRDRESQIISLPAPVTTADLPLVEEAPPLVPSEQDVAHDPVPDEAPAPGPGMARLVKNRKVAKDVAGGVVRRLFAWPVIVMAGTLALAAGSYVQRERVVKMAPQSAVLFAAVGAPVNLRGIDIRDVKSRMVDDNGVNVLVIDGNLVSVGKERVNVPRLRFSVLGENGQEIYVWSAQADRATLQPGETLNFRRRLAAPPVDGKSVGVRFLTASDSIAGLK